MVASDEKQTFGHNFGSVLHFGILQRARFALSYISPVKPSKLLFWLKMKVEGFVLSPFSYYLFFRILNQTDAAWH